MATKEREIREIVLLAVIGDPSDPMKAQVGAVITSTNIEVHVQRSLSSARQSFSQEGFVRDDDQQVDFPHARLFNVQGRDPSVEVDPADPKFHPHEVFTAQYSGLEVWVKYAD